MRRFRATSVCGGALPSPRFVARMTFLTQAISFQMVGNTVLYALAAGSVATFLKTLEQVRPRPTAAMASPRGRTRPCGAHPRRRARRGIFLRRSSSVAHSSGAM